MLAMNSFVVPRVGHDHAQKIVGIAAHQVTFHHFGNIPRLTLEGCQITVLLAVQCDGDEHVIWETGQGLIHQTNVTPDEAMLVCMILFSYNDRVVRHAIHKSDYETNDNAKRKPRHRGDETEI